MTCEGAAKCVHLFMDFLMACCAESDQILGSVIAQSAPRLNVMDLKIFHSSTSLATPSITLQNFPTELAVSFRSKSQSRSFPDDPRQSVTWMLSRNCLICVFGRPRTIRVNEGKRPFKFVFSALTPARKSARIISKQ